jgi:hypothetical protein
MATTTARDDRLRAYPNGWCWCGCGGATTDRAKFLPGHDATARSMILDQHYEGDTATMVLAHGYGPPGPEGFGGPTGTRYIQNRALVQSFAERITGVRGKGISRRQLQEMTGIVGHNTIWRCEVEGKLLPEEVEPLSDALERAERETRQA